MALILGWLFDVIDDEDVKTSQLARQLRLAWTLEDPHIVLISLS
jgi:hypothetical protein